MTGSDPKTFVTPAVIHALKCVQRLTPSYLIGEWWGARKSYVFFEGWVLFFAAASIAIFAFIASGQCPTWLQWVLGAIGAYRIFDCLIHVVGTLFHAFPHKSEAREVGGYRRLVILVSLNYLETIFWFAGWYGGLARSLFRFETPNETIAVLRESLMLMVANTSGKVEPNSLCSLVLVTIHSAVGLFLTSVVVAYVVSMLPRPPTADKGER